MSLLTDLREHTKQSHLELDHGLYPIIQQIKTNDDYARLLRIFYGFFQPMYEQFDGQLGEAEIPDYKDRRKPEWILQDLETIGKATTDIPICPDVPELHDKATALGSYYVLEGSTMGGTIISKKIGENLNWTDDKAARFFKGYGEANREMWNKFLNVLDGVRENHDELIDSAQNCFRKFKVWIDQQYGNN